MTTQTEYVWRGEASSPNELADEIAALVSQVRRLPYVEPIEMVTMTMSAANRDLIVDALRKLNSAEGGDAKRS